MKTYGDAEVGGGAQDLQGFDVTDVLEGLAVDLQDLVAALQTHFLRFRSLLHLINNQLIKSSSFNQIPSFIKLIQLN